jgi:octanoyl-[GcvH]:protein N-octanoyltransferase
LTAVPLYTESPPDAALDVAISHALLRAAAEDGSEAVRVWTPPPALSFGRLDLLLPSAERAIAVALAEGLHPIRRLAGGRAAATGPGTVCLGWACRSPELAGMQERYEAMSEVIVQALSLVGVRAGVGELAGEWCPGAWSVIVGDVKVGGLAQRMIRGGAWAEAVIVVSDAAPLRSALDRVQRALGVPWDPATFAGLADIRAGVTVEDARGGLIAALQARRPLDQLALPAAVWSRAESLRDGHDLIAQ